VPVSSVKEVDFGRERFLSLPLCVVEGSLERRTFSGVSGLLGFGFEAASLASDESFFRFRVDSVLKGE